MGRLRGKGTRGRKSMQQNVERNSLIKYINIVFLIVKNTF